MLEISVMWTWPAALHICMRIRVPQYACAVKVPFREIGSRCQSFGDPVVLGTPCPQIYHRYGDPRIDVEIPSPRSFYIREHNNMLSAFGNQLAHMI